MQEQEKGKGTGKTSSDQKQSQPIPKSEDQQRRHEEEDFNDEREEFRPEFPDTNYPPEKNPNFPEDKENRDSRLDLDEEGIDENGYGTEDEEFNDDF